LDRKTDSLEREKRRKKSKQGHKGQVGRPKKTNDPDEVGEEPQADGYEFFDEEIQDTHSKAHGIMKDRDDDGEDDAKSRISVEILPHQNSSTSNETSSHSHPSVQTQVPQTSKTPRLPSPRKGPSSEEADLFDVDRLYSWEDE